EAAVRYAVPPALRLRVRQFSTHAHISASWPDVFQPSTPAARRHGCPRRRVYAACASLAASPSVTVGELEQTNCTSLGGGNVPVGQADWYRLCCLLQQSNRWKSQEDSLHPRTSQSPRRACCVPADGPQEDDRCASS